MGGAEYYDIFLQACKENETFERYNDRGGCGLLSLPYTGKFLSSQIFCRFHVFAPSRK